MEVGIREMREGEEVDQLAIPPLNDEQILGGAVYPNLEAAVSEKNEPEWSVVVDRLLPHALPYEQDDCAGLLEEAFRGSLPQGVLEAVTTLVAMSHERQARALLVDFLRSHRDAHRIHRLMRMQLLFRERLESSREPFSLPPESVVRAQEDHSLSQGEEWDWCPAEEETLAPDVDDHVLRTAAAHIQKSIGQYRPKESGERIFDLEELVGNSRAPAPKPHNALQANEKVLLERVARLGTTAIDLLRYFSNNPGDKATHAEAVLGYPMLEIRRLLLGSLSHFLRKTPSGGWECQPWVDQLLHALDESTNGG